MEVSCHKLARDPFNLLALLPILALPTLSWTSSSELSFSYFHRYDLYIFFFCHHCQYRLHHSHSQYQHHGPHQPCQNQYIPGHYQYLHNVIKALTRLLSGIFCKFPISLTFFFSIRIPHEPLICNLYRFGQSPSFGPHSEND